jgi:hypothetical protein
MFKHLNKLFVFIWRSGDYPPTTISPKLPDEKYI